MRAARGLRVYSDAYSASLRSALATNFAALARVLSPPDFDRLATAYLRAHPPRGFDYVRLGGRFAGFIGGLRARGRLRRASRGAWPSWPRSSRRSSRCRTRRTPSARWRPLPSPRSRPETGSACASLSRRPSACCAPRTTLRRRSKRSSAASRRRASRRRAGRVSRLPVRRRGADRAVVAGRCGHPRGAGVGQGIRRGVRSGWR